MGDLVSVLQDLKKPNEPHKLYQFPELTEPWKPDQWTNVFSLENKVERDNSDHINPEPARQVMTSNCFLLVDQILLRVEVSGEEGNKYVDQEEKIDWLIYDYPIPGFIVMESYPVRGEKEHDDQKERNNGIPKCFKWVIWVKYTVLLVSQLSQSSLNIFVIFIFLLEQRESLLYRVHEGNTVFSMSIVTPCFHIPIMSLDLRLETLFPC